MRQNELIIEQVKNDLLTMENYIERYQPINYAKTIQNVLRQVLSVDKYEKVT